MTITLKGSISTDGKFSDVLLPHIYQLASQIGYEDSKVTNIDITEVIFYEGAPSTLWYVATLEVGGAELTQDTNTPKEG